MCKEQHVFQDGRYLERKQNTRRDSRHQQRQTGEESKQYSLTLSAFLLRTDLKGYLYYRVQVTQEETAQHSAPPEGGTSLAWWPPRASPE